MILIVYIIFIFFILIFIDFRNSGFDIFDFFLRGELVLFYLFIKLVIFIINLMI